VGTDDAHLAARFTVVMDDVPEPTVFVDSTGPKVTLDNVEFVGVTMANLMLTAGCPVDDLRTLMADLVDRYRSEPPKILFNSGQTPELQKSSDTGPLLRIMVVHEMEQDQVAVYVDTRNGHQNMGDLPYVGMALVDLLVKFDGTDDDAKDILASLVDQANDSLVQQPPAETAMGLVRMAYEGEIDHSTLIYWLTR